MLSKRRTEQLWDIWWKLMAAGICNDETLFQGDGFAPKVYESLSSEELELLSSVAKEKDPP